MLKDYFHSMSKQKIKEFQFFSKFWIFFLSQNFKVQISFLVSFFFSVAISWNVKAGQVKTKNEKVNYYGPNTQPCGTPQKMS